MPASFAYAILRHRLFDLRLIVRQGLRYALARRLLDALIPALGGVLLVRRARAPRPSRSLTMVRLTLVVVSRWSGRRCSLVRSRREDWLSGLDRRFFRERYDAQRLLEEHRRADQPRLELRGDRAVRDAADRRSAASRIRRRPPAARRAIGSSRRAPAPARRIRRRAARPRSRSLACSRCCASRSRSRSATPRGSRHQLPATERALLVGHGIELLVPISDGAGRPPSGRAAGARAAALRGAVQPARISTCWSRSRRRSGCCSHDRRATSTASPSAARVAAASTAATALCTRRQRAARRCPRSSAAERSLPPRSPARVAAVWAPSTRPPTRCSSGRSR